MNKMCKVGLMVAFFCSCLVGVAYADVAPPISPGWGCAVSGQGASIAGLILLGVVFSTSAILLRQKHRR